MVLDPDGLEVLARVGTSSTLASEDVRLNLGKGGLNCSTGYTGGRACNGSGDTRLFALYTAEDASLLDNGRATVTLVGSYDGVGGRSRHRRTLEGDGAKSATTLSSAGVA